MAAADRLTVKPKRLESGLALLNVTAESDDEVSKMMAHGVLATMPTDQVRCDVCKLPIRSAIRAWLHALGRPSERYLKDGADNEPPHILSKWPLARSHSATNMP